MKMIVRQFHLQNYSGSQCLFLFLICLKWNKFGNSISAKLDALNTNLDQFAL